MSGEAHDSATAALREAVDAFAAGDLARWHGLPAATPAEVEAVLGAAGRWEPVRLGTDPALRAELGAVAAYQRDGQVVMLEALAPPPLEAVRALGEPSAVLPAEILSLRGYVGEHVYDTRGLLVGVLRPWDGGEAEVARCRGIAALAPGVEPGPELYLSFEDQIRW